MKKKLLIVLLSIFVLFIIINVVFLRKDVNSLCLKSTNVEQCPNGDIIYERNSVNVDGSMETYNKYGFLISNEGSFPRSQFRFPLYYFRKLFGKEVGCESTQLKNYCKN